MQKANVIESHPRHKRVFHEVLAGRRKLLIVLVIVPDDAQDFTGRGVNRDAIGDFKPRLLALVAMFKAANIKLAIALVDFTVAIIRVVAVRADALLAHLLALNAVELRSLGRRQVNVTIYAEDLQTLHCRGAHVHAMRNALGVA